MIRPLEWRDSIIEREEGRALNMGGGDVLFCVRSFQPREPFMCHCNFLAFSFSADFFACLEANEMLEYNGSRTLKSLLDDILFVQGPLFEAISEGDECGVLVVSRLDYNAQLETFVNTPLDPQTTVAKAMENIGITKFQFVAKVPGNPIPLWYNATIRGIQ